MTRVQARTIEELTDGFEGQVLLPGDGDYESARKIWNAMIDKRPAVILRCATTPDVVRGVSFARDNGLVLAVRGGGHNIAGNAMCDDGLVIDLSKSPADNKRCMGWAGDSFTASGPVASGSVSVNCLTAGEGDRVRSAYGPNYERLARVKRKCDPENLFCTNQNIEPA